MDKNNYNNGRIKAAHNIAKAELCAARDAFDAANVRYVAAIKAFDLIDSARQVPIDTWIQKIEKEIGTNE